jgi:hypothetical protein
MVEHLKKYDFDVSTLKGNSNINKRNNNGFAEI